MRTSLDAPFLLHLAVSLRFVVAIVATCQILGIKAMRDFRLSPSAGFNTPSPIRVPPDKSGLATNGKGFAR